VRLPIVRKRALLVTAAALVAVAVLAVSLAPQRYRERLSARYHALVERVQRALPTNSLFQRQAVSPLKGPLVPVFSMFDGVDLYQKNGLTEIYGGALQQHRSGPIRVSHSALHVTHDRAFVFWSPDFSSARDATHVEIEFARKPEAGRVTVGLITASGTTWLFAVNAAPPGPAPKPAPLPALVPDAFVAAIAKASSASDLARHGEGFVAELPAALREEIANDDAVRTFFVMVDHAAGTTLVVRRVGLARPLAGARPATAVVAGRVAGAVIEPGATVSLVTEKGETIEQQLSLDHHFRFEGIPTDAPVSLRFQRHRQNHYSTLGRWFVPEADRLDLRIELAPLYVNTDGHAADPTKAKFVGPRTPSTVGAFYEPHTRQYWPGGSTPQEYDSTTFSNNMGFIDRDRFFENPDGCFRIVHLGSSHAVALQVRPFEKYNIEMESELAVRIQRCVEVISAGRDNGDIGSNYPRVRDYAVRFKPDLILLENSSALVMQLQPELLKRGFGWDHEHSALDSFFYNKEGVLELRPWSADYGLHATKPDFPEYLPGVSFFRTVQLPLQHMPAIGRDAFRYLADIMAYFQRRHPDQQFVIHTALDEAQCRERCETPVKNATGIEVPAGAATFVSTHRQICERHRLNCIYPTDTRGYGKPETYLNFVNDGHYSVRGHQWLARELSKELASMAVRER